MLNLFPKNSPETSCPALFPNIPFQWVNDLLWRHPQPLKTIRVMPNEYHWVVEWDDVTTSYQNSRLFWGPRKGKRITVMSFKVSAETD
ncbi:hypothetical protein CEXT_767861 [Caerostris extrusa]|uniref:Uncharacterized protein n=1 Tax=Caerostris extrusa TaxID=172846 RepID=A0AAV4SHX3_CAEEX|nr:hypothetical protein CEXT_767861 [Caerostris extrusa]